MAQGLTGTYKNNAWTGITVFTRVDSDIDFFNYGSVVDSRIPNPPNTTFIVDWSGYIQPLYSETYTFTLDGGEQSSYSDWVNNGQGAAELVINGQTICVQTSGFDGTTITGTIALSAGVWYPIFVWRSDNNTNFVFGLKWQSASQGLQIVPPPQLATVPPVAVAPGYNANPARPSTILWPIPITPGYNPRPGENFTGIANQGPAPCLFQRQSPCPGTQWIKN